MYSKYWVWVVSFALFMWAAFFSFSGLRPAPIFSFLHYLLGSPPHEGIYLYTAIVSFWKANYLKQILLCTHNYNYYCDRCDLYSKTTVTFLLLSTLLQNEAKATYSRLSSYLVFSRVFSVFLETFCLFLCFDIFFLFLFVSVFFPDSMLSVLLFFLTKLEYLKDINFRRH